MLTIRLLGEMTVLRDQEQLVLPPSKKTRALLAYLVATGRRQRRERLCTMFWEVPDDPRGALRWSLSKLRALVDEPDAPARLLADRDSVTFLTEGVQCDLRVLRDVASRPLDGVETAVLHTVADGIDGEFLAGLELPGQPDFQAWCLAEREDARRQYAAVLEALVDRLAPASPETALPHARKLVELDGFAASPRAVLVTLLGRLGRREEALQHFEVGMRLIQEAGMSPGPLTAVGRELRATASSRRASYAQADTSPEPPAFVPYPALARSPVPQDDAEMTQRLVVVDDEPELGRMVAEYLGGRGFVVRTATNGRALYALLAEEPADLVILDINMPGEDGFAVARRLRTETDSPRIIFLSAASDIVDRVAGLELGAEDYITKPFDLRELRARINIVLRRPEASPHRTEPISQAARPAPVGRLSGVEAVSASDAASNAGQDIRFCRSADGVRIAYATIGEGPPLLKPANWLTHLEHDWQSPVWRHWMRELSRGRRLIRYDERGNGLSDWQAEDLSFDACKRDLEAVVEAAGLQRFPMLGISQGCASALAYAVDHPERVSRLVLYGGYARGWAKRGNPSEIATRAALGTLMRHGWGAENPAFRQSFTSLFIPDGTPEQARWFNELQRATAPPDNALRLYEMFGSIQLEALLPRVSVPTLVLHCTGDNVVPFDEGRRLATAIPGARFVPLDGRNHILLEDEPAWTRFLTEVRSFLDEDNPR
jgi:DNA-binding response OmpR family regulator/pimeloyl-ACP methyl ester carboxylesterase/DNA-binding SARP family transcriptional activator